MKQAKDIINNVKKVEIQTRHLVDGLIQGTYHSVFKGRGIEFNEVREYQHGDDVRTIDWNVTARMNAPYVKEYIEERDLTVYIVMDVSASGNFGHQKQKKESGIELAASIMFAASRNNDRVGLALFTDRLEHLIPAKKGRRHVLRMIREMISFSPRSLKTDIRGTLRPLAKMIRKRSVIFIISDFICPSFRKSLRLLKRRNDVIAVRLRDVRESEIPDVGLILLEDEETGEQVIVDTSDPVFRKEYASLTRKKDHAMDLEFRRSQTDVIDIRSGEDIRIPIRRFFRMRMKRVR